MFSAMSSRPLVLLLGLVLAIGAGWAIYELRRDERLDGPPSATSDAAPEQMLGGAAPGQTHSEEGGPGAPVAQAPAAPADPRASDDSGGRDRDAAAVAAPPPAAQTSTPERERSQARVEHLEDRDRAPQQAEPVAPVSTDEPAAPPEPQRTTQPTAPVAPRPDAPATSSVAEPLPSRAEPSSAVRDDRAGAGTSTPPAPAPQARAAPDAAAERAAAAARSGPPDATGSARAPAREPPPGDQKAAPAVPPTATEQVATTPERETEAAAEAGTVVPDAPTAGAAPSPSEDSERAAASQPGRARVAETIRRAVAALFGGGIDEPAAGEDEAQTAAVPDGTSADPVPDRDRGTDDTGSGAAPSFDIVRVRPDGQAVIAGRATPGAEVELRSGERTIDRVRADQRGEWVALPPEPLGSGVQELSLAARVADQPAVASAEVVVVAVPEPPPPQAVPAAAEAAAAEPMQVAAAAPGDEAFAVALPRQGAGKGRILQAPGRIGTDGALALVMLDYDDAGRIRLSGEADAGAALRIYVDNQPAGTAVVGPGGKWEAVLEPALRPGDYTLRLDQLDPAGRPDARLETPFTRVSHPPVAGDGQADYVIVQPGNSLWRIARRVHGEGMHYVHIYQANQAQIRDPDLIYPGQVFELPRRLGAAG
jgi:nucleoid-associated protein YgaU